MNSSADYDLVMVGSSFASAFFLQEVLRHAPAGFRVLVLEKGRRFAHFEHLQPATRAGSAGGFEDVGRVKKPWVVHRTFGGNSHYWWACTPRLLPEDFEMRSRYGVGVDWPLTYDDLEPFYVEVERTMSVAGAPLDLLPRSEPFPQDPHVFNDPDRLLAARYPDLYTVQPCARARRRTAGRRACCAVGTCGSCPRDAKFTVENELRAVFDDPRVTLKLQAEALQVEWGGAVATGVRYLSHGDDAGETLARADFVALGANAIFNPAILLRSGLDSAWTGAGLNEQRARSVRILLDGVRNFQGSTSITGHGYMCYPRPERSRRASALIEHSNKIRLRPDRGRHREVMSLKFIYEDLPQLSNRVVVAGDGAVQVVYGGESEYCRRGKAALEEDLEPLLAALPVESVELDPGRASTESHILGTTRMSRVPDEGVVDADLLHHRVRNLAVLGSGAFPTSSPSNPTLTLSALSVRSARRAFGRNIEA